MIVPAFSVATPSVTVPAVTAPETSADTTPERTPADKLATPSVIVAPCKASAPADQRSSVSFHRKLLFGWLPRFTSIPASWVGTSTPVRLLFKRIALSAKFIVSVLTEVVVPLIVRFPLTTTSAPPIVVVVELVSYERTVVTPSPFTEPVNTASVPSVPFSKIILVLSLAYTSPSTFDAVRMSMTVTLFSPVMLFPESTITALFAEATPSTTSNLVKSAELINPSVLPSALTTAVTGGRSFESMYPVSPRVITILFALIPPSIIGNRTADNAVGATVPSTFKSVLVELPVTLPTTSAVKSASVPSVPASKTTETPFVAYTVPWIFPATNEFVTLILLIP